MNPGGVIAVNITNKYLDLRPLVARIAELVPHGLVDLLGSRGAALYRFDPDTGLFYVGTHESFSVFYLTDTDPRPQGWGAAERHIASVAGALKAIDYKTGKVRWSHPLAMYAGGYGGGPMGLLSTAGGLLFGNDGAGNFVAYDVATGKPLWHAGLGANTSNGPQTFMIDGKQYVVVGAGDSLFSFALQ